MCGKHINGLQAGGNANPLVKNNKIRNSSGSGIVLHDWSRGTYANNHVEGSKLAGVGIRQKKKVPVWLPVCCGKIVNILGIKIYNTIYAKLYISTYKHNPTALCVSQFIAEKVCAGPATRHDARVSAPLHRIIMYNTCF